MYHVPDEYYKPLVVRELGKQLAAKHNEKDSDDDEADEGESNLKVGNKKASEVVDPRDSIQSAGSNESSSLRASGTLRPNTSSSNLLLITEKLSAIKPSRSSTNLTATSAYAALPPTPISTLMKSPSNVNLDLAAFIGTTSSAPETKEEGDIASSHSAEEPLQFTRTPAKEVQGTDALTSSPSQEDGVDGQLINQQLITEAPVYGDFFSSDTFFTNAMRSSAEEAVIKSQVENSSESPQAITTASPSTSQIPHQDDDDGYGFYDEEPAPSASKSQPLSKSDQHQQSSSDVTPQRSAPAASVIQQTPPGYEEGLTPIKVQKMLDEMKTPAHHSQQSDQQESTPLPEVDGIVATPAVRNGESTSSTPPPSFALSNAGTPVPSSDPKTDSDAAHGNVSNSTAVAVSRPRTSSSPSSSSMAHPPIPPVHTSAASTCRCPYCLTFSLSLRLQRFHAFHHSSDVNRMIGNPSHVKSNSLFHLGGVSGKNTLSTDGTAMDSHASLASAANSPIAQLSFLHYGAAYVRASRVMSWIATAMTPREMIFYLTLACKWILRDAIDISGSRSIIGADLMVPLFTLVLIHSEIPNIHMLLYILLHYGDYDEQGDISYNLANLEGSLQFVMSLEVSMEMDELFEHTTVYRSIYDSIKVNHPYLAALENQSRVSDGSIPSRSPVMNSSSAKGMLQAMPEPILPKIQFNKYNIAQSLPRPADICNEDIQAMEELGKFYFICFGFLFRTLLKILFLLS